MNDIYIEKMNVIFAEKKSSGKGSVRLLVADGKDTSVGDVAYDFCSMEDARKKGLVSINTSLEF